MEFHLPYFILQHGTSSLRDDRAYQIRGKNRDLRRCRRIPTSLSSPDTPEFLYEAQISLLISGLDEWFWTAFFFVDTYFSSRQSLRSYHERGIDALRGEEGYVRIPVWNPRGYFLLVFSRRFRQVTKEWCNLVNTIDARLDFYVRLSSYYLKPESDFFRMMALSSPQDHKKFSSMIPSIREHGAIPPHYSYSGYFQIRWLEPQKRGSDSRPAKLSYFRLITRS